MVRWGVEAVFQVDGKLAGDVVWVERDVTGGVAGFDPADRAVVVPFGAGDPDVAMLAVDPGAGVADGPVVGSSVGKESGVKDALFAGDGISGDEVADDIGGAGEVVVVGVEEGGSGPCLIGSGLLFDTGGRRVAVAASRAGRWFAGCLIGDHLWLAGVPSRWWVASRCRKGRRRRRFPGRSCRRGRGRGRGKAGGFHGGGHDYGSCGDAAGDPVVPLGEFIRRRSFCCVEKDSAASIVGGGLSFGGLLCCGASQTNDGVLLRCDGHGIEIAVEAQEGSVGVAHGDAVGGGFNDEPLAGEGGLDVEGDGTGEEREFGVGNAVGGAEVVEGEDGVFGEIDGGGVFEFDLGSAGAGDEIEAGRERKIGCDLLPGFSFVEAAGDADVTLNVADADDLVGR